MRGGMDLASLQPHFAPVSLAQDFRYGGTCGDRDLHLGQQNLACVKKKNKPSMCDTLLPCCYTSLADLHSSLLSPDLTSTIHLLPEHHWSCLRIAPGMLPERGPDVSVWSH